jgi:N-acetylglucosamine malate deacetylase 1
MASTTLTVLMKTQKINILAFSAHPDDAELGAAGTLLKAIGQGHTTGIVDLTGGELGSRGNVETRKQEALDAGKLLKLSARENLAMPDGFFEVNEKNIRLIITCLRKYQPDVVLCNAPSDRHPDHGRASQLVREACFYSGLNKIETNLNGEPQQVWRPKTIYQYIQDYYLPPDFVVDVTEYWDKKIEVIQAFKTQFYDPQSAEPLTPISGKEYFEFLKGRAYNMGRPAGYLLAEGFITTRALGIEDITSPL